MRNMYHAGSVGKRRNDQAPDSSGRRPCPIIGLPVSVASAADHGSPEVLRWPPLPVMRIPCRIPGQTPFAGFQELFGPGVVLALGDPLATTQLSNAVLAAQAFQNNADFLLRRPTPAGLAPDILYQLLRGAFLRTGFSSHRLSSVGTMSRKSSLSQPIKSIRQVLKRNRAYRWMYGNAQGEMRLKRIK